MKSKLVKINPADNVAVAVSDIKKGYTEGDITALADDLLELIVETANGKKTKNEINNYRDISIFKDGVIM